MRGNPQIPPRVTYRILGIYYHICIRRVRGGIYGVRGAKCPQVPHFLLAAAFYYLALGQGGTIVLVLVSELIINHDAALLHKTLY